MVQRIRVRGIVSHEQKVRIRELQMEKWKKIYWLMAEQHASWQRGHQIRRRHLKIVPVGKRHKG